MGVCEALIVLSLALCGAGILVALAVPERRAPLALAFAGGLASLALVGAGAAALAGGAGFTQPLWSVSPAAVVVLRMGRLAGLFALVAGVVFLAVSVFCKGYMRRYLGRYSLRSFGVMYLALLASVVLILAAGDLLLFLLAWEAMSILTYLLVSFEHGEAAHARAGWVMLAFSEVGALAAMLGLLLLATTAGSLDFAAMKAAAAGLAPGMRWAIFLLTFFGFGVKAGLVPVNSWLPRAHPVAPGPVSALLSTVILNLGLYGIVLASLDLAPLTMVGPGLVALVVGTATALVGILYATTERDLKVVLAHSSIENMGIVTVGLGAGFVFAASGQVPLAAIAFVAALYHMTNHSIYKAQLFLGAATVDERVGTRDLDRLGGLIRTMPWTALFFLAGALSIAAMPPFSGFVSEWLTLQAVLRSADLASVGVKLVFAVCGAGLALTAALAVTCFVKAFAMGFLGKSRSEEAGRSREAGGSALAPMALLAALSLGLGVLPTYVIPVLGRVATPAAPMSAADTLVPSFFAGSPGHAQLPAGFAADFHKLGAQTGQSVLPGRGLVVLHRGGKANPVVFAMSTSYMAAVLLLLLGTLYGLVWLLVARRRRVVRGPCWDGGIRRLLPEMTYTATGFSNPVRVVFDAVFHPTTVESERETVAAHFRTAIRRERVEVHLVDRVFVEPARRVVLGLARLLAGLHNGKLNAYLAYALLALLVAMMVAAARLTG